MDVLKYHQPVVDWQKFHRGPLSEGVWRTFQDAVLLCHAFKHWSQTERQGRAARRPAPFYSESKYLRRKRKQEWQRQNEGYENHKMRAAFLAAEKLWTIAHMVQGRDDTPDWHLSLALIKAVPSIMNTLTGHERAEFGVLAFKEFDAASEVGTDSDAMARRWRAAVGQAQIGA